MNTQSKKTLRRLIRQLSERHISVIKGNRKERHYQNKRIEFVSFINNLINNEGFVLTTGTRIYKIYHDNFN